MLALDCSPRNHLDANYFRMSGKDPYTVTLTIRKPGAARAIEAKFDLKR